MPLSIAALFALALFAAGGPARAQFTLPPDFVDELVVSGLTQPVGMAFTPDGRLFVVERATARVRLIVGGVIAAVDPVVTVPGVDASYGEEGLLGVAVDPGFPARPYLYVQYTASSPALNRIARFTVGGDLAFAGNGALTVDPATRYDILEAPHEYEFHNGGTLRFGPDGMLYSSLGDYLSCGSQNLTLLLGKIVRLDVSGLPAGPGGPAPLALLTPADNPFVAHASHNARLVWQWGLRNPFRFAIDPQNGDLAIGDVGGSELEEVNFVSAPGRNFQWPIYEGEVPGPYFCSGVDSAAFTGPVHTYDHTQGAAVIGGVIYRRPAVAGSRFPPEYEGDIFFCDFYGTWLRRLKRTGNIWALAPAAGQPNASDWGSGATHISDWLVAADGALWYCRMIGPAGPGQIRRIRYAGVVSAPPPSAARVELGRPYPSPSRGSVTLEYVLDEGGPVTLAIHDLAGRRVARVIAGERRPAGRHRAEWDGRDGSGNLVGPGVYLAALDHGSRRLVRRIAMVR